MVDNGLIVEQVAASRKMRHIFLFNDVFICARQKVSGGLVYHEFLVIPTFDTVVVAVEILIIFVESSL